MESLFDPEESGRRPASRMTAQETYHHKSTHHAALVPLRRGAPETSREAAARIAPVARTLEAQVLRAFIEAGNEGLTDAELFARLEGQKANSLRPRRVQLCKQKLLANSGRYRPASGAGKSTVWVLATGAGVNHE